ncbi:MAG TPA: 50S ribosomal protein L4 [Candidatus Saccharimonadales bacterium]|nr:50S ribosomal protein L4 [Candidatus Saccharimonadales bacterium]
MSVATYTKGGAKATTPAKLNKAVFGVEVTNHELLKDAYLAYLANARPNLAVAKKRGEVSGGGRKPWRQKGTGRARFGSSRNPIWTGGGVAFGPNGNENYSRKLNTAAKRTAIRQALSMANKENRIKVIEKFVSDGKVKPAVALLAKIEANGNVLLVVANKDEAAVRATRNIKNVRTVAANYLNVYDLMNADVIVMENEALKAVHGWLGGNNE